MSDSGFAGLSSFACIMARSMGGWVIYCTGSIGMYGVRGWVGDSAGLFRVFLLSATGVFCIIFALVLWNSDS